jgi:hypothetical protein
MTVVDARSDRISVKLFMRIISIFIACALAALAIVTYQPFDQFIVDMLEEENFIIFIAKFLIIGVVVNLLSLAIHRIACVTLQIR